jgi:hypothetical protein
MTRSLLVGAAAFTLLAGCAHTVPPATAAEAPRHGGEMMAMCPMDIPGTQVSSVDEVNGSTVTFTAQEQMHNQHHAGSATHEEKEHGGMMGGMMGSGGEMKGMMMPPSHATFFELDNGASLKVMPSDPADLQKLQDMVRKHVERMQHDGCEMMGEKHPA